MVTAKKIQIIEGAKALFKKYGYKKVSVEEIASYSRVSKMTFYKYFSNKLNLVQVVLGQYQELGEKRFLEIIKQDILFPEKMNRIIKSEMDLINEMGQLFLDDLYDPQNELYEYVIKSFEKSKKITLNFFLDAQKKGAICKDFDKFFFMFIIDTIYEQINDERLKKLIPNMDQRVKKLAQLYFFGITARS